MMIVVDLDEIEESCEISHLAKDYDVIFYIYSAFDGANTGDHFLGLLSSYHLRDKTTRVAYMAHPNHRSVASFFQDYLDAFFVTKSPGAFAHLFGPRIFNMHVCGLSHIFSDGGILRHSVESEKKSMLESLLPKVWNPWNYFLLNQTSPREITFSMKQGVGEKLPPKSVLLFPERSDHHALTSGLLEKIKTVVNEEGYQLYCNAVKNSHFENPVTVDGVHVISPSMEELVDLCQDESLVLIGTRSGIFDVLYFTSKAKMLVIYPEGGPDFIYQCRFNSEWKYFLTSEFDLPFRDGVEEWLEPWASESQLMVQLAKLLDE